MAARREDNAFSEEKMMIGVRSLALGICIIGREGGQRERRRGLFRHNRHKASGIRDHPIIDDTGNGYLRI